MNRNMKIAAACLIALILAASFFWINGIMQTTQSSANQQNADTEATGTSTSNTENLNISDLTADHLETALQELEEVDFNT